jgi:hypothetical protein
MDRKNLGDRRFYTYAWLRESGTPYYIGRGTKRRAWRTGSPSKDRVLILKDHLTFEESVKHEIYMIFVLGRKDLGTGILRNLTDGGDGSLGRVWTPTEETRRKISEALKGRPKSKEHLEAVSAALVGRSFSEEHRENLSKAWEKRKQIPVSQETRDKISNLHKGRKRSEETRRKISESAKLREQRKRNNTCNCTPFQE